MLHHWTNLLVTPLTHSPDLETGALPPKYLPVISPLRMAINSMARMGVNVRRTVMMCCEVGIYCMTGHITRQPH